MSFGFYSWVMKNWNVTKTIVWSTCLTPKWTKRESDQHSTQLLLLLLKFKFYIHLDNRKAFYRSSKSTIRFVIKNDLSIFNRIDAVFLDRTLSINSLQFFGSKWSKSMRIQTDRWKLIKSINEILSMILKTKHIISVEKTMIKSHYFVYLVIKIVFCRFQAISYSWTTKFHNLFEWWSVIKCDL